MKHSSSIPEPKGENHSGTDLSNHNMYGLDLRNSNFDGALMWNTNLDQTRLSNASFVGADLHGARFQAAGLDGVNFDRANLSGAVLLDARVAGASFASADLRHAILRDIKDWDKISSVQNANIYEIQEAPQGFIEWAPEQGAIQEAPPPTRAEEIGARLIAFLTRIGKVLKTIGEFLELFPWHPKRVHVRVVRRGPKAIVKWRSRNVRVALLLQGASLAGAQLAGADLGGADMREIDLAGANLEGAVLGSRLNDAQLPRANLRGADISGDLRGANLRAADLSGASVSMANLGRVDLQGATLAGADVSDTSLRGANLRDADFQQTNLDDTQFHGAVLEGARLNNAKMYMAKLVDCDLAGVDLTGANLTEVDLEGATNYTEIRGISGASINRVHNAPEGFIEWAVSQGAVDESRSRSWAPADSLYLKANAERAEKREMNRASVSTHKILWPIALLGIVFFITGIGGIIGSEIMPLYRAFQMRNWEEVNCEIVLSEYSLSDESVLGIKVPIYRANVEYRYWWKGLGFLGTAFEERAMETEGDAKRFAEEFPVGREMEGFLNPSEPVQSVLVMRRFGWPDLFRSVILLICTGGGAFCLLMGFGNHE